MWSWIKNLFKKKEVVVTPPVKPIPEIPTSGENLGLKIALVRGHGGNDSGAAGNGTNEVEYNTWVMEYVLKNTKRNVKCFYGDSSIGAVYKSVLWSPQVTIQLHLNDADALSANGCEILVIKDDLKSYVLAERFAASYGKTFNRTIRREKGKKILGSSDRGAASVRASVGVKMLVEPFFIRNKNDFVPKEEYAKFLVSFLDQL